MARMLGRWLTGGCHCRPHDNRSWGPDCAGHDSDSRKFKRQERRELERELAPEADSEWLASIDPLVDLSDCQHGCNGWPCGSERCTFVCHEGLPMRTYWDGDYRTVTLRG